MSFRSGIRLKSIAAVEGSDAVVEARDVADEDAVFSDDGTLGIYLLVCWGGAPQLIKRTHKVKVNTKAAKRVCMIFSFRFSVKSPFTQKAI